MSFNQETMAVQYLFESEPQTSFRLGDIAKILGLRGKQLKRLQGIITKLNGDGVIKQIKPGLFQLVAVETAASGRLTVLRSGMGYITDKTNGTTIWVPREDMERALPGDTVALHLTRSTSDEKRGRVVNIEQRAARDIVGTLSIRGNQLFVSPLDPAYKHDFTVPDAKGGKEGDRIVIRLTSWDNTNEHPQGEVVDVIGPADKPSLDTDVICRQYNLPGPFAPETVREAEKVGERLQSPGKRLDLREDFIFTIDPAKARDFDDALSLHTDKDGNRVLGVHIADVGHFVRKNSPLDKEAQERGTTVYLVDKVIPMLPEQLSNGVCSLRPDEDRLALSAFLTFNESGQRISHRFAKSIVRSRLRLTYEQALAIIDNRKPEGLDNPLPNEARQAIPAINHLARQLRQARMDAGALDLEVPECEVILDKDGRMTEIKITPSDHSHQMIEECMVAANEAVASELSARGINILARLHEPPDPEKIEELQASLNVLGFKPGDLSSPKRLARFIASTANHPLKHHVHSLVLRSMKRAVYSADDAGHFGLAKRYYSHFTSPIRRYPDLILHRQLAGFISRSTNGGRVEQSYLKAMAEHTTEMEQRADDSSRALIEIKKYRFLQQQLDDANPIIYDATVSRVTNFGIFLDITALQLTAMVHVSMLGNQFFHYNRGKETLSAGDTVYRIGSKVRAHVVSVDFPQRRADFKLVTDTPSDKTNSKPEKTGAKSNKARAKSDKTGARTSQAKTSTAKPKSSSAKTGSRPPQRRSRRTRAT